ncbi:hypothetical protein Y695_02828 [Hydrogenophaga sp. T4]|nr:hypothetical protein Y695_02828 [Hydrogenophaga sp. T4]
MPDLAQDVGGVVVEGEQGNAPLGQPVQHLVFTVQVEGFVAQVQARVAREVVFGGVHRRHQADQCVTAAQAGLPGEGDAVKGGGNAVGHQLPVGLGQGQLQVEMHARAGHDLALEGVTMQVDDAGHHAQATGVHHRCAVGFAADLHDDAVVHRDDHVILKTRWQQGAASCDRKPLQCVHAWCPR